MFLQPSNKNIRIGGPELGLCIPMSCDLEGYGYCIPIPPPICAPDLDLSGARKVGHVPFVPGIPVAAGPFPAEQLPNLEHLVSDEVLRVSSLSRMHIITGIPVQCDQAPRARRSAEEGVRGLLPQPQAQLPPTELLTSSQSRC